MPKTVLHVEPPGQAAANRVTALQWHGCVVHSVSNTAAALDVASKHTCEVALVHRVLSGLSDGLGLELRRLRPTMGIVMLAPAWDPCESRAALAAFADDCVPDNVDDEDLCMRVRALCRRGTATSDGGCSIRLGPLRVDFVGAYVEVDGREVPMQPLQVRILGHLLRRAGNVVTREELRKLIFRAAQASGSTSVPRQISILRKQLGARRNLIATVEGGYRFSSSGSDGGRASALDV